MASRTERGAEVEPTPDEPDGGLRVLFNVAHPAQVHLFRNAIDELQAEGHETLVTSREKEITIELLDAYDIDHVTLTRQAESFPGLVAELLQRERRLLSVAREFDPDVIVSRLGPPPVHVSRLVGAKNVIVSDTLRGSLPMRKAIQTMTLPFVDTICMPEEFDLRVPEENRRNLSFQELAYLHPRYFTPDPDVLEKHGIDPDETFYVLRLTGWDAYHDVGHDGISPDRARELISFLSERGTVYLSSEIDVPEGLDAQPLQTPPEDVHHVLYYADMYLGDSCTMSSEAAILGTPAIRTNSLVGNTGEPMFADLEEEYGLLQSYADEEDAIAAAKEIATDPPDRRVLRRRRTRLVDEQPDVTAVIVESIKQSVETNESDTDHV